MLCRAETWFERIFFNAGKMSGGYNLYRFGIPKLGRMFVFILFFISISGLTFSPCLELNRKLNTLKWRESIWPRMEIATEKKNFEHFFRHFDLIASLWYRILILIPNDWLVYQSIMANVMWWFQFFEKQSHYFNIFIYTSKRIFFVAFKFSQHQCIYFFCSGTISWTIAMFEHSEADTDMQNNGGKVC